jgi:hypothetical protein
MRPAGASSATTLSLNSFTGHEILTDGTLPSAGSSTDAGMSRTRKNSVQSYIDERPLWADGTMAPAAPMTVMQLRIWWLSVAGKFFEGLVMFMTGVALPLIAKEFNLDAMQHGMVGAATLFGILKVPDSARRHRRGEAPLPRPRLGAVVTWLFRIETAGLDLEEMGESKTTAGTADAVLSADASQGLQTHAKRRARPAVILGARLALACLGEMPRVTDDGMLKVPRARGAVASRLCACHCDEAGPERISQNHRANRESDMTRCWNVAAAMTLPSRC